MRILFALTRFPWPTEKGDKLRAFMQIKGLAQHHDVHLVCIAESEPSEEDMKALLPYCKSIHIVPHSPGRRVVNLFKALFNRLPFQVNYFRSPEMKKEIRTIIKDENIDAVMVQFVRMDMNIPFDCGKPFFLDYQDCLSLGMENRLSEAGFFEKIMIRKEARRLRAHETECSGKYAGLGIISDSDAKAIRVRGKKNIIVIPNGVNDHFLENPIHPSEKKYDLLFTGNLGYYPNVKAAEYIVREILPLLKAKGMDPVVCFAGARPAKEVQALASEKIIVTGYVEDLKEYFNESKIFVAPLMSGSGLQNKLLESMAMGLPTITTSLCNAALKAPENSAILVCDDAKSFAHKIQWLMENPKEANKLGEAGREFIRENFNWEKANGILERALMEML